MRPTVLPGIDDIPDDTRAVALAKVERLTELLVAMPGNWYYETCLRQWRHELENPLRYAADEEQPI